MKFVLVDVWGHRRRLRAVATTVIVLAAFGLAGCSGSSGGNVPTVPSSTTQLSPASPSASVPASAPAAFPYVPLYPFANLAQATAWQRTSGDGHEPWHADPGATATSFTVHYLGFSGINQVVRTTVTGKDARVAVGFALSGGPSGTAAVIHLVRYGTGTGAGWEVVGTDDTTFTLNTPRYGARVTSPFQVDGRITGVDESIHVQARRSADGALLGNMCCLAAGGTNAPWATTMPITGSAGDVATVVAWTGGHSTDVERFTVTGIRR